MTRIKLENMRVDHLTFSSSGGAGIVAGLLVRGQNLLGIDSNLHVMSHSSLWKSPFRNPSLTVRSGLDKYLVSNSSDATMFSFLRRGAPSIRFTPDAGSILHLHWMEGMLQRKTIVEWLAAGRKVVLTLHDMAPFTGGCHQSLGCRGYETSCRACPQVRTEFRKLVENRFSHLPDLADFKNQLVVVAPTSWMRNMALQSRHFSSLRIEVIENPIDPSFFESYDRENARADLGIPVGTFVACIVSAQLNNPAKRVEDCIEVFSQACGLASIPGVVLLVGDGGENLSKKYPFAFFVGSGGPEHVAKNLAAADVLLSGSEAESAGMTIREASAQGLASIVVSNGGSDEMITSSEIGRVVKDFSSMKEALFDTISGLQPTKAREQAQKAKELAWAQAEMRNVSRKYVDIYRELQGIGG